MQIQKVNSNRQKSNLNFGTQLGEIRGLEAVRPDLSNHELSKFYRTLESRIAQDSFNNKSVDYDLKRIDKKFIECKVSGNAAFGYSCIIRLTEVTEDILATLIPRG